MFLSIALKVWVLQIMAPCPTEYGGVGFNEEKDETMFLVAIAAFFISTGYNVASFSKIKSISFLSLSR